jgi:hypothetical protein
MWAAAERDLLARAFPQAGAASQRAIRCLIVAPAFGPGFLDRLGLLTVTIDPFVARPIPATDPPEFLVEPAAAIYAPAAGPVEPGVEPHAESWQFPVDGAAESPLPPIAADDPILRGFGLHDGGITVQDLDRSAALVRPHSPDRSAAPDRPASPDGPMPVTESLTAEELEEFERFDRVRRVRDGTP